MGKYFEPWSARRKPTSASSFQVPDDWTSEQKGKWQQDANRAEKKAPTLVWGSGVWDGGKAVGLVSGQEIEMPTEGIVFTVEAVATRLGNIDSEHFAERIAACVNFCEGVDLDSLRSRDLGTLAQMLTRFDIEDEGWTREKVNALWPVNLPDEGEGEPPEITPKKKARKASDKGNDRARKERAGVH